MSFAPVVGATDDAPPWEITMPNLTDPGQHGVLDDPCGSSRLQREVSAVRDGDEFSWGQAAQAQLAQALLGALNSDPRPVTQRTSR